NLMAVLNPNIRHDAIDGALFQDEIDARQVMSVPTVYLNGENFAPGRMSVEEILAKVDTGAADRTTASMQERDPFDVLVAVGGPAGAAPAIFAVRIGFNIGVAAQRFGGEVLDASSLEYFVSVKVTDGLRLAAELEEHVRDYVVDIMNLQTASK